MPEQISLLDDVIDEPLPFESSKDLYYSIKVNQLIDEMDPQDAFIALSDYLDYQAPKKVSNLDK